MKITNAELKVVRFNSEDVIATSLYYMPSAAFNALAGTDYSSDYVQFEGIMTGYDPDASGWAITNIGAVSAADTDEMDGLKSGGSFYFPDVGITIPMSHMAPLAQQAYEAYSYNDGYYTKGATFYETYWQ